MLACTCMTYMYYKCYTPAKKQNTWKGLHLRCWSLKWSSVVNLLEFVSHFIGSVLEFDG